MRGTAPSNSDRELAPRRDATARRGSYTEHSWSHRGLHSARRRCRHCLRRDLRTRRGRRRGLLGHDRHPETPAAATAAARAVHGPHFYVSLGDSLSQGVQPDATGGSAAARQGYPDQLYAVLRRGAAGLRLIKLGCSGETTSTMVDGGTCHYPAGSQLAAAALPACPPRPHLADHHRHRRRRSELVHHQHPGGQDRHGRYPPVPELEFQEHPRQSGDDPATAAAGSKVTIIGMSYYVPELAGWLANRTGKEVAAVSERLGVAYNGLLAAVYQRYRARGARRLCAAAGGGGGR